MIRGALMWADHSPACVSGFGETVEKGHKVNSGRDSAGSGGQGSAQGTTWHRLEGHDAKIIRPPERMGYRHVLGQ